LSRFITLRTPLRNSIELNLLAMVVQQPLDEDEDADGAGGEQHPDHHSAAL